MSDYTFSLNRALACTVGAANQCQQHSLSLDCTACYLTVQDPTTLDSLRAQMLVQRCIQPLPDCLCVSPGETVCVATDGGGGACNAMLTN